MRRLALCNSVTFQASSYIWLQQTEQRRRAPSKYDPQLLAARDSRPHLIWTRQGPRLTWKSLPKASGLENPSYLDQPFWVPYSWYITGFLHILSVNQWPTGNLFKQFKYICSDFQRICLTFSPKLTMDGKKLVNNFLFSISANPPFYSPNWSAELIPVWSPMVSDQASGWSLVSIVLAQPMFSTVYYFCLLSAFENPRKVPLPKRQLTSRGEVEVEESEFVQIQRCCEQRQLLFRLSGCIVGFMIAWLYHSMVVCLHGSTVVWTTRWHGCMVECNYMQTMRSWDQQLQQLLFRLSAGWKCVALIKVILCCAY